MHSCYILPITLTRMWKYPAKSHSLWTTQLCYSFRSQYRTHRTSYLTASISYLHKNRVVFKIKQSLPSVDSFRQPLPTRSCPNSEKLFSHPDLPPPIATTQRTRCSRKPPEFLLRTNQSHSWNLHMWHVLVPMPLRDIQNGRENIIIINFYKGLNSSYKSSDFYK